MPRLKKDDFKYIKFEGLDILKREYAKNRGVVILTAHMYMGMACCWSC